MIPKALSLLLLLALGAGGCLAETSVYVVDVQKVLDESVAGKAARNDMEDLARKEDAALALRQKEFVREKEDLDKQKGLLSSEALEEKAQGLEKRHREFMRQVQDKREELGKRSSSAIEKVVAQIDKVIAEMARDASYPYVIEKDPRLVIFVNERFDLTAEVIKRLNKQSTGL